MSRKRLQKTLRLQIGRDERVQTYYLHPRERFKVGSHRNNHAVIYDPDLPEQMTLVEFTGKGCFFHIYPDFTTGEVSVNSSTLRIEDLVVHGLLEQRNGYHRLKVMPGARGVIRLGQTYVGFDFVGPTPEARPGGELRVPVRVGDLRLHFRRFLTWGLAVAVSFHLVAITLFALFHPKEQKVPERVVRVRLMKYTDLGPPPSVLEDTRSRSYGKAAAGAGEGNRTSSQTTGLLNLISSDGTGRKSGAMGFLQDHGLLNDLDAILGGGLGDLRQAKSVEGLESIEPILNDAALRNAERRVDDLVKDLNKPSTVKLERKAQVTLAKPSAMKGTEGAVGQRSAESLRNVILNTMGRFEYVYTKYLKRNPDLRGKIVIEITIDADGLVTDSHIVESTINDPDFERDVVNIVRRWRFEPIDKGTVTVQYPLLFYKADS